MEPKSIREIVREEWKKLSALTWKQRFGYIWDYYKPLMAAILVVICAIGIGVEIYQNKQINHLLEVYLVNSNSYEIDSGAMTAEFEEYIGGIGPKDEITIDTSLMIGGNDQYSVSAQMKLTAVTAAGTVDVILFTQEGFDQYRDSDALQNLTKILNEDQLAQWSELLEYGKDPETGEHAPIAVRADQSSIVQKYHAYYEEPVYAVVMANAPHPEMSAQFLQFLMEE